MLSNIEFSETLPKTYLDDFLDLYNSFYKIDKTYAIKVINDTKRYYQNPNEIKIPKYVAKLQNAWYLSMIEENYDYSVYDDEYYFTDIFCCWDIYSRKYLNTLKKPNLLNMTYKTSIYDFIKDEVNTVVDLGNGLGLSTAYLKQIFNKANVYGTNLSDTKQWPITNKIGSLYNFKMIEDEKELKNIDFLFASEYYEHIQDCIDDIEELFKVNKPKIMYLANSFNTKSVGHFTHYKSKKYENYIDQSAISRKFNKTIRDNGYVNVKTKNWNNKPTLWLLKESFV
jgi:hypothetical protein